MAEINKACKFENQSHVSILTDICLYIYTYQVLRCYYTYQPVVLISALSCVVLIYRLWMMMVD